MGQPIEPTLGICPKEVNRQAFCCHWFVCKFATQCGWLQILQDFGTQICYWDQYKRARRANKVKRNGQHRFVPPLLAEWIAGALVVKCCLHLVCSHDLVSIMFFRTTTASY